MDRGVLSTRVAAAFALAVLCAPAPSLPSCDAGAWRLGSYFTFWDLLYGEHKVGAISLNFGMAEATLTTRFGTTQRSTPISRLPF
jgi:hypothetical protein